MERRSPARARESVTHTPASEALRRRWSQGTTTLAPRHVREHLAQVQRRLEYAEATLLNGAPPGPAGADDSGEKAVRFDGGLGGAAPGAAAAANARPAGRRPEPGADRRRSRSPVDEQHLVNERLEHAISQAESIGLTLGRARDGFLRDHEAILERSLGDAEQAIHMARGQMLVNAALDQALRDRPGAPWADASPAEAAGANGARYESAASQRSALSSRFQSFEDTSFVSCVTDNAVRGTSRASGSTLSEALSPAPKALGASVSSISTASSMVQLPSPLTALLPKDAKLSGQLVEEASDISTRVESLRGSPRREPFGPTLGEKRTRTLQDILRVHRRAGRALDAAIEEVADKVCARVRGSGARLRAPERHDALSRYLMPGLAGDGAAPAEEIVGGGGEDNSGILRQANHAVADAERRMDAVKDYCDRMVRAVRGYVQENEELLELRQYCDHLEGLLAEDREDELLIEDLL